jgi:hypothetical protein
MPQSVLRNINVRDTLTVEELNLANFCVEIYCELVGIECFDTIIVSLYHSPSGDFRNFCVNFENCLAYLTRRVKERLIIAGDFNVKAFHTGSFKF